MLDPITDKDLKNFEEQLRGVTQDKDRLRLIKTIANDNWSFASEQVKRLVIAAHYGEAKIQAALLLYPNVTDKQNFKALVLPLFFDDEKASICSKLNL
ncbi:hypothetical protein CYY_005517 [Polysphondylium violaceum]|uniref:DUF4476 domain-containing protein n=1 Tax=Polysphondylium violaceum TaxID=133409 RepID=A0A8J4PW97_9MYCE|nr:hypothetical protein CYY_005517 [Polysphondylium violaceum]